MPVNAAVVVVTLKSATELIANNKLEFICATTETIRTIDCCGHAPTRCDARITRNRQAATASERKL